MISIIPNWGEDRSVTQKVNCYVFFSALPLVVILSVAMKRNMKRVESNVGVGKSRGGRCSGKSGISLGEKVSIPLHWEPTAEASQDRNDGKTSL